MNYSKYHRNDWKCSSCQTIVYGNTNKIICICGQTKWNSKTFTDKYNWQIGDKLCVSCNQLNFKSNNICKFCNADL